MLWNKVKIFLEMIKFEHTIFALPFAYLGAFLAVGKVPSGYSLFWITMAMVGARTAAMALNRVIDRHIDALNPRTQGRALPSRLISIQSVWIYVILSFLLLFWATLHLNSLCVRLMPIAVFVLVLYSYTKRFTWFCHFVLGIALGLAPLGSWVAMTGRIDLPALVLAGAVALWTAGFDIIYALQDFDFDKAQGLYSIPARFGKSNALMISSITHVAAPLMLFAVGWWLHLGLFYLIGVGVASILLYYEHELVSHQDLSNLSAAFFNMNGYLSTAMFAFSLLDIFVKIKVF